MSKTREVTVIVYVDGELYHQTTNKHVEDWAVSYVAEAAVVQVDEPDYDAARNTLEDPAPMRTQG